MQRSTEPVNDDLLANALRNLAVATTFTLGALTAVSVEAHARRRSAGISRRKQNKKRETSLL